jgi:hypothetical protein
VIIRIPSLSQNSFNARPPVPTPTGNRPLPPLTLDVLGDAVDTDEVIDALAMGNRAVIIRGAVLPGDPGLEQRGDPPNYDALDVVIGYGKRNGCFKSTMGEGYAPQASLESFGEHREVCVSSGADWCFDGVCVSSPHCGHETCHVALGDHFLRCIAGMRGCKTIMELLHPASGAAVVNLDEPYSRGPNVWHSAFTPLHLDREDIDLNGSPDPTTSKYLFACGLISGRQLGTTVKEVILFPPGNGTCLSSTEPHPAITWLEQQTNSNFNLSAPPPQQDPNMTCLFTPPCRELLDEEGAPDHVILTLAVGDLYVIPPGWAHTFIDVRDQSLSDYVRDGHVPADAASTRHVTLGFLVEQVDDAEAQAFMLRRGDGAGSGAGAGAGQSSPGRGSKTKKRKRSSP